MPKSIRLEAAGPGDAWTPVVGDIVLSHTANGKETIAPTSVRINRFWVRHIEVRIDASDERAVPMPGRIILMLIKTNANKPRKLNAQGCALLCPAFSCERSIVTMDANIEATATEGDERVS
jgi:hypothetical protein